MTAASLRRLAPASNGKTSIPGALAALIATWDRFAEAIPLGELKRGLGKLRISRGELGSFVSFSRSCYRRNRIHVGPAYEILALCWASGQRSPIHDHHGSACALRIVEGIATETRFEFSPSGLIFATGTNRFGPGAVTASYDSDIHQMGNLEPAECDLVTLHVYSPPLVRMGRYYLGDSVMGEGEVALRSRLTRLATRRRPSAVKRAVAAIRSRARRA